MTSPILARPLAHGVTGIAEQVLSGLGAISFSLYLLHVPVGGKIVNLGLRWLAGPGGHLVLSLIALAGSLLAATLFWRFVERPCTMAAGALADHLQSSKSKPLET